MKVEFDSVSPSGDHGDEPGPKAVFSAGDHGIVQVYVEFEGKRSRIVDVSDDALVSSLLAMMRHENRVRYEDSKFRGNHDLNCKECGPKKSRDAR